MNPRMTFLEHRDGELDGKRSNTMPYLAVTQKVDTYDQFMPTLAYPDQLGWESGETVSTLVSIGPSSP